MTGETTENIPPRLTFFRSIGERLSIAVAEEDREKGEKGKEKETRKKSLKVSAFFFPLSLRLSFTR